jgi:type I restriction enzyme S subunit
MSKWMSCTVQELVDRGEAEVKTGPFGTQLHASDYVDSGIPVINVRNIGFGSIRPEKLEYISEETAQRLSTHLLKTKDIVFGRKGAVERHVFIQTGQDRWFQGSDCLRLRVTGSSVDPRYVSYSFLSEDHKSWMMNQCSHGATMASLNQDIVKRIPLQLPPLETQRKIASILSAYDDLIENNTRRIKILEEMARMIYREWFVNFRFPGHDGNVETSRWDVSELVTDNMPPSQFRAPSQETPHRGVSTGIQMVDSPLGMIPEGWEVKKIKEVAMINTTSIKKSTEPDFINYVDIASVSTGQIDKIEVLSFENAPSRARRIVKHGDMIWSTVRPNRKSYAIILQPTENMIVSTGFAVLSAISIPYTYLFQAATTDDFVGYLINHASGAAYPAVNGSDFENADLLVPPKKILDEFHKSTESLYLSCHNLQKKNQNLRQTRDLLLPKLISGEVAV